MTRHKNTHRVNTWSNFREIWLVEYFLLLTDRNIHDDALLKERILKGQVFNFLTIFYQLIIIIILIVPWGLSRIFLFIFSLFCEGQTGCRVGSLSKETFLLHFHSYDKFQEEFFIYSLFLVSFNQFSVSCTFIFSLASIIYDNLWQFLIINM